MATTRGASKKNASDESTTVTADQQGIPTPKSTKAITIWNSWGKEGLLVLAGCATLAFFAWALVVPRS